MKHSSRVVSMTLGLAMVVGLTFAGAPASMAASPSESARKAFISSVITAAQNSQRQWGIPASVSIAQAIESTDFGTSPLATKARNYFGIRCSAAMTAAGFASLAVAQVGKPYVLGAEALASNPDPKRFDCSELVEWLYARSGNKITDLAAAQYNATRPVSGSPKTGDLVFLRNNPARSNGIGHVAVLTTKLASGEWEIVEARGRAYGVVKSTLSYWKQRSYYAGLRRSASLKFAGSEGVALSSNSSNYQSGCVSITAGSGKVTKYRSYSSISYSFADHAASVANDSAYQDARGQMADIPSFVEEIAKVEDPDTASTYAKTIKNLISTYNLSDYDVVPMSVVLFSGAKGPKVTALQHLLLQAGSSVKVTGTYDAATTSAVKSYQSAKKLTVDGEAGPATLSALFSKVGSGSTGNRVSALHALLHGMGLETTSGASFGPATVEAVKAFQALAGLTPDGSATTNTWAKLFMTVDPAPELSIKGTVATDQKLTAVPGTWGPSGVELAYQWYRGTTAIKGATATTYTVQPAD
ncbi:MAG: peptidoglycan-binding protein, partial [Propionicimonas sp.]